MKIEILHAFRDNYIYLLVGDAGGSAAVVDPGDASPVLDRLAERRLRLSAILNTHHHQDHVGGNAELLRRFPGTPVYAGALDRGRVPGQTGFLADGEEIRVEGAPARILGVPGHTLGHVAYFFPGSPGAGADLFSGDTVFGGTVGNLFEGTPDQMFESIAKIRRLPPATRIWCAHEYTLAGLREALELDPGNELLQRRLDRLAARPREERMTTPLELAEELATNPFFRWDDPALQSRLGTSGSLSTFSRLCDLT